MFVHPTLSVAAEADWLAAQSRKPTPKRKRAIGEKATSSKPAKPAVPTERQVQRAALAWMRRVLPPGSLVQHIANQSVARSDTYRAHMKRDGQVAGWPDLAVCVPCPPFVVWLEMKRPVGGALSAAQAEVHARLRAIGHAVGVATGIEEVRHVLRAAGVPLREAEGQPAREAKVRTVKARIGGSRFALPADKVPSFSGSDR